MGRSLRATPSSARAPVPAAVRAVVATWRAKPVTQFLVWLRRKRAGQLRQLLAHPAALDLDTFNREVWRFGESIAFQRQHRTLWDLEAQQPSPKWLAALQQAIDQGQVALHGSFLWRPPTGTFYARERDTSQRLAYLRHGLTIVNEPALSPLDKAQRMAQIPGFGSHLATGLVTLFHPTECALRDYRSVTAVRDYFGYPVGSKTDFGPFQASARHLQQQFDAADFLELDTFLDVVYASGLDIFPPVPRDQLLQTEESRGFPEGRKVLRIHLTHERNPALVRQAKDQFKQKHDGKLCCAVCAFDFAERYGPVGTDYIEVHHAIPVSQLRQGDATLLKDVALVCSNCHRMLHRRRPWLGIQDLRDRLVAPRRA